MYRSSHDCEVGGRGYRNFGGWVGWALCAVYILVELLRDSLARETTMQWRNKSPILLAFERFKPVETESILRDRGAWAKEDDFSDTPVLKAKAGAVFISSVHPRGMLVLVIQSSSPQTIDFL